MWPKVIQINKREVYFLGGLSEHNKLIDAPEASFEVYHLNLVTMIIKKMSNMIEGRFGCGGCLLNEHIYITGGLQSFTEEDYGQNAPTGLETCERYNVLHDQWSALPGLPLGKVAPTLIALQKRYIYQFGGLGYFEAIYKLDVQRLDRWQEINVNSLDASLQLDQDFQMFWGQLGILPLNDKSFLVFGGIDIDDVEQSTSLVLQQRENSFRIDDKYSNSHTLVHRDRFFNRSMFEVSDKQGFKYTCVVGRNYLHLWNQNQQQWHPQTDQKYPGYLHLLTNYQNQDNIYEDEFDSDEDLPDQQLTL